MCPVIRVSDELYTRLESHAVGFDTPSALIERLLDKCDALDNKASSGTDKAKQKKSMTTPVLIFYPSDEDEFKHLLIKQKQAAVVIHKADGTIENRNWKASRLSSSSNLRGNLWSGLLRGWKKKGIIKVEFSINN